MFAMNTKKADQIKGEFSGQITAHAAEKIYTANAASIGNWPVFNFQVLFFSKNLLDVKKPLVYDKKIRPVDLSTRSEEHTSELQSLMRISYAVVCLKQKK